MAEITLGDLLAWEPRLRPASGFGGSDESGRAGDEGRAGANRELTWAVAARATAPMLPPLRGGELVLLPHRVLAESGVTIGPLLRELASHAVAGVVLEAEAVPPGLRAIGAPLPIVVLPVGPMGADLESDINRLLTERRGELYRAGTDLGRLLAGLTSVGADVGQVLAATADALRMAVVVADAKGHPLASVAGGSDADRSSETRPGTARRLITETVPLTGGETLVLGPVPPERRALVRLAGERVAAAVQAALTRSAESRPRGPARAAALTAFLTAGAAASGDIGARALALGLKGGTTFRVAVGSSALGTSGLQRLVVPAGSVHEAAPLGEWTLAIVEVVGESGPPADTVRGRVLGGGAGARDEAAPRQSGGDRAWLAISAPVADPRALPAAARQARYVAGLLARGVLRGPIARFDDLRDVGPFRLLYEAWGSAELVAFAEDALGELPRRDRRGTLRETLLAYLETGGSHVEAAARLGIHRNTLAYRLRQIGALTGFDPTDPGTRPLLHLALLASSLPPVPGE
jgi:purine catabolism regulator